MNTADVTHRPEAEVKVNETHACRISSASGNSDDVFVADADGEITCNGDIDDVIPDESPTTIG